MSTASWPCLWVCGHANDAKLFASSSQNRSTLAARLDKVQLEASSPRNKWPPKGGRASQRRGRGRGEPPHPHAPHSLRRCLLSKKQDPGQFQPDNSSRDFTRAIMKLVLLFLTSAVTNACDTRSPNHEVLDARSKTGRRTAKKMLGLAVRQRPILYSY